MTAYQLTKTWDNNYKGGRLNRFPFDCVVSYVHKNLLFRATEKVPKVLDLGFGGGNHLRLFQYLGFDAFGVDASPTAKEIVLSELGADYKEKLSVGDFTSLPYDDASFDFVLDRQSIGHNKKDDIDVILSEVHRVLKKDALFFSVVFGDNTTDLKFGNEISPGTVGSFTKGVFVKSGFLTPFNLENINSEFSKYFYINEIKQNQSVYLNSENLIETYEISARKK
jgi:SAM-dependent methyltransferase